MLRLYVLLISTGFLMPVSATAQEASQMGLGIRSGQQVRVRSAQGQLLEGRYAEVPLGADEIDSLWVRGNRAKTGALIGGLVFGAGSAVLGSWACTMSSDGHGCQETGKVVAFTAVGAAVGVGVGALIGSAVGTWRLQYARPGARIRVSPVSLNQVRLDVTLPL
jgi:hypothetical protein